MRARPEFLQGNDIEFADQFAASLIHHQVGANGTVRSLTRMVAQMTVTLIRGGAPPEAAACRALAIGDLDNRLGAAPRTSCELTAPAGPPGANGR